MTVPDLPHHSGGPEEQFAREGSPPRVIPQRRLRTVLWAVLVVLVLVAFVVLHLTGVLGPGQH